MRLQKATRFALYAVLELASNPERQFSAGEIAERFEISGHHLSKVLRTLGRAGLVEALRGAGGGYRFRGNPKRITLLDVIQLFEEVGTAAERSREPGARTPQGRALGRVLEEIDAIARATLGSITVATMGKLIQQERPPEADRRPAAGRALARAAD
jgi:Rrf2 family protein